MPSAQASLAIPHRLLVVEARRAQLSKGCGSLPLACPEARRAQFHSRNTVCVRTAALVAERRLQVFYRLRSIIRATWSACASTQFE
jgi:hypothetical protein